MGRKLLGLNAMAVPRLAFLLLALAVWCAPGIAAADAAAPMMSGLEKSAYDNPYGNTHVVCLADASQSYELYIPHSVPTTGPAPIFYGFDPGGDGKGTLLVFANAAAANGWILAVSNNSMNGPWSTIFAAQDAVIRDTEARLNLSPTRRFAGGMSGGGRTGLALAFRYPSKICGVLPLGAGWPVNTTLEPSTDALNVYMIVGTQDSNYTQDIPSTQGKLIDYSIRCVVKTFNGGHVWPPADMILAGCQWLNANAERDPNSGLPPADCPAHSLFCQPPSPIESSWNATASDTTAARSLFDSFQGATLPITRVDWWGMTAVYNTAVYYWLPCDPPADRFIISLHPDSGGVPGPAVHEETVTAIREDLPHLYERNFPLRHYHTTLSAPVSLASGWVRIQQVRNTDQRVLLFDSPTGDGQCLRRSDTDGTYTTLTSDLAVSLKTEEMTVQIAASQDWGRPPLTVQFRGSVGENVMAVTDWQWDFGDESTGDDVNDPSPIHTYDHEGTYTVSLTVSTQLSSAAATRRNLIVVSHTLPLATPGVLGALLAVFACIGSVVVRRKRTARKANKKEASDYWI